MEIPLVYGVVVNGKFYSNRIERPLAKACDNGIYSLDMTADDFWTTLQPANIPDAVAFFRRASKVQVLRGISFNKGIIPDNPIAFPNLPLTVTDGVFEDFEQIEVAILQNKVCYFLQTINTAEAYTLADVKDRLEKNEKITDLKGITPPMRLVYVFHLLEKQRIVEEKKRKEEQEPLNVITRSLAEAGGIVHKITSCSQGYEVVWESEGHTIRTLLGKRLEVKEAGFCVSGYDREHTVKSVGQILKTYVEEGSRINLTRTAR